MPNPDLAPTDRSAGWECFTRADWTGARDVFAAQLAAVPGDPEALDGYGQALWWLGDREAGIAHRREAYVAYRRRGDALAAGRIATYLAGEHRIDGQMAASAGWLARARRLLDEGGPSAERGGLAIEEAKRAEDPAEAEGHARAALAIAHRLGDPGVECMALAQLGRALVRQGRVAEGTATLDEAMTVALGGESQDSFANSDACCTTLVVCERLADLRRATEWCELVVEYGEQRSFTPVQSWCRGVFAHVLVRAGDWERAEAVLLATLAHREGGRRDKNREKPLGVLAELRLRQGRPEEAEKLVAGMEQQRRSLPVLVELRLGRGELGHAAALLAAQDPGEADPELLEARGALALAEGDRDRALACAARLGEVPGRPELHAAGRLLAGRAGDPGALAEAVDAFAALDLPHERARAQLALAEAQAAAGSPLALASATAARDTFARLGARIDADRAGALLRSLGASGRAVTRGRRDALTAREKEVLALIAAGLSNAQIAERLVIARKTAEHHVSRVLAKLGARSRAEAAALAVRDGV